MRDFLAFTIKFNGITNRIVTDVEVSAAFDPANPPSTPPVIFSAKALWDTGATGSAISPEVVTALGLTPVGRANVNHAGGFGTSATYIVNVFLPNRVGVAGVLAHEFVSAAGAFGFIVGMDIIARGDLALTHDNGKSCMSFRMPSCQQVDFVEEANRLKQRDNQAALADGKVGRNDPCICGKTKPDGSPRKFKNCCGIVRA